MLIVPAALPFDDTGAASVMPVIVSDFILDVQTIEQLAK